MLIDEHGNKLSQPFTLKKDKSKTKRIRRISQGQDMNPAFCGICGYRVRGEGHIKGSHHNTIIVNKQSEW